MSLLAARPAAGHDALLHAGAGGVGLAAHEYCRFIGNRSDGERRAGRTSTSTCTSMGLAGRTLSSRDGAAFALGAARLLGARRLRFALNSLSADFIACSFALLRQGGWLCEIGKRSGVEPSSCRARRRQPRGTSQSRSTRRLGRRQCGCEARCGLLSSRAAAPCCTACRCSSTTWRGRSSLPSARCRAAATSARWWCASRRPRRRRRAAAHLLSGGTGGLGLVTGRWLGERGAASVVLAARGGSVAPAGRRPSSRQSSACSVAAVAVRRGRAELTRAGR